MRRTLNAAIVILLAAAVLTAAVSRAQSLPSKKEAAALLQKTAEAANLRAAGTPPYHLAANLRLQLGAASYDGAYDLWWAAPDRYKEGFALKVGSETFAEIDLALADKLYTLRNTPTLTYPLAQVRAAVRSVHKRFYWGDKPQANRVFSTTVGGQRRTCVDSDTTVFWTVRAETCFDPATLDVFSVSNGPHFEGPFAPPVSPEFEQGTKLADFGAFAGKRYPRRIKYREFDMAVQIDVVALEESPRFEDDTFVPPPQTTPLDWCVNPTREKDSVDWSSAPTLGPFPTMYTAYYIFTDRDGRVQKTATLRSGGAQYDAQMEKWLRGTRQPIKTCGGKPIEWEAVVPSPETVEPR